ncbi:MAG: HNH endonuclease [Bacteroidota bacterium]
MNGKVLVLNQDYSAFSVCSVQKAFLLVYLNKAEPISDSKNRQIRSISQSFALPSIIRLHKYVNLPYRNGVMLNRQNVFRRDGHKCQYCGSVKNLTLDHVIPRSKGGRTTWDNLLTACQPCNSRKGDYLPDEANMTALSQPYRPSFLMFLRDFSGKIDEDWLDYLGRKGRNQ